MEKKRDKVLLAARRVEVWVERNNYKGYEPFDGLSSRFYPLTFNNTFLQRLLQQLIRQSPVNLRPLFGVKPLDSTKGRGYMAWGYLLMYKLTSVEEYKNKALLCLDWLDRNKSLLYKNHSWGNHFDYASRGGKLPKYEPTVVWTSLIGQAYLTAYELFKLDRHLEIVKNISQWIIDLPRERTPLGNCIAYTALGKSSIHNSNMLGAAFLAISARYTMHEQALLIAKEAMNYSCSDQLPNGAWYYGKNRKFHWIDSFHTGYNLDSLKRYINATGDKSFNSHLEKGYSFFKNNFFEKNGCPRYYYDRKYPLDIQCASQAIDTLCLYSDVDKNSIELALKVAEWTIKNMQNHDGHFYYRKYPIKIKAKAPMIHWGQATMFKSLAHLWLKLNQGQRKR